MNGKGLEWRAQVAASSTVRLQSKAKLLGRFLLEMKQHALQILRSFFFVGFQATGEKNLT